MGWRSRMLASFPLQADAPDFGRTTRCCCRRSGCSRDLRHPQRLSSWLRHETKASDSTARRARRATGRTGEDNRVPQLASTRRCLTSPTAASRRRSPMPTGWRSSTSGGPIRAFDRRMPAFGDALTERQIQQTIDYIRGLCRIDPWPRGELNLPRALLTEKAFPENEAVLSTTILGGDSAAVENELLYEQRLGPRSQFEVAVPVALQTGRHRKLAARPWGRSLRLQARPVSLAALRHDRQRRNRGCSSHGQGEPGPRNRHDGVRAVRRHRPGASIRRVRAVSGRRRDPLESRARQIASLLAHGDRQELHAGRFGRSWSPMIEIVGAQGPRRRRARAVGCRPADAGDAQPAATHHDQCRRTHSAHRSARPRRPGPDLPSLGLVRWRPVRWLAVTPDAPSIGGLARLAPSRALGRRQSHGRACRRLRPRRRRISRPPKTASRVTTA